MYLLFLTFILGSMPLKAESYKESINFEKTSFTKTSCSSKKTQTCQSQNSAELTEEIRKMLESK